MSRMIHSSNTARSKKCIALPAPLHQLLCSAKYNIIHKAYCNIFEVIICKVENIPYTLFYNNLVNSMGPGTKENTPDAYDLS
ncbi:MAG: hypothetical protein JWQ40_447 [Segetibacter sp.]|nr:hypothetical protein [Segetibacter sp.]